jgi:hypothetical protein
MHLRSAVPTRLQGASPRLYSVSSLPISAAPRRDPAGAALSSHRNALPSRALVTVGQLTAAQLRVQRSASTARPLLDVLPCRTYDFSLAWW